MSGSTSKRYSLQKSTKKESSRNRRSSRLSSMGGLNLTDIITTRYRQKSKDSSKFHDHVDTSVEVNSPISKKKTKKRERRDTDDLSVVSTRSSMSSKSKSPFSREREKNLKKKRRSSIGSNSNTPMSSQNRTSRESTPSSMSLDKIKVQNSAKKGNRSKTRKSLKTGIAKITKEKKKMIEKKRTDSQNEEHEVIDLLSDDESVPTETVNHQQKKSIDPILKSKIDPKECSNLVNIQDHENRSQQTDRGDLSNDEQSHSTSHEGVPKCHSCDIILLPPYSIHAHPSLAISVCAECSHNAYATESDVREMKENLKAKKKQSTTINVDDNTNVDDCCLCCGECDVQCDNEQDEELQTKIFLCDYCPRSFCGRCILICVDGNMETLRNLDRSNGKWGCSVCSINLDANETIIPGLLRMQKEFQHFSSSDTDRDENISPDNKAEKLIAELDELESKIEEALEMLEKHNLNIQREKIVREIKEELYDINDDGVSIEEEIEREMELYEQKWKAHHTRLVEALPPLQEALEEAGVSLLAFYNTRNNVSTDPDKHTRRAADKEIDARSAAMGFSKLAFRGASGYKSLNPKVYSLDLDDVPPELLKIEDINTTEDALDMMKKARRAPGATNRASFGGVQVERIGDSAEDDDYLIEREKDFQKQFLKAVRMDDLELDEMKIKPKATELIKENRDKTLEKNDLKSVNTAHRRVIQEELWLNMGYKKTKKKHKILVEKTNKLSAKGDGSCVEKRVKKRVTPMLVNENPIDQKQVDTPFNEPDSPKENVVHKSNEFDDSDFVLNRAEIKDCPNAAKSISVSKSLTEKLKSHQKDGVQFMWNNVCDSFVDLTKSPPVTQSPGDKVHGCIIAHSMGLGKTLQVLALLHTLFVHPELTTNVPDTTNSLESHLRERRKNRMFHRALICVPVNTIANWEQEFRTWYGKDPPFKIHIIQNSTAQPKYMRPRIIEEWYKFGGILLTSFELYVSLVGERVSKLSNSNYRIGNAELISKALQSPGADIVIIDEAHQVLKKSTNKNFKALASMSTTRRVALTGTPIQNNLIEYFHLVNWIQPGVLGTVHEFEREYVLPMKLGMASDSSQKNKTELMKQSRELHAKLAPFVHRLDSNVLRKDLPFMQQAVIHVRQSKAQTRLYRAFKKYHAHENVGMIEQCSKLRPVYNHPGCLLMKKRGDRNGYVYGQRPFLKNNLEENNDPKWWHGVFRKHQNLADVKNGGKISLLLQIIAHSDLIDDKVVVFSQSIATLDFIEIVLNAPYWEESVQSLKSLKPNKTWGSWRKNVEYLRIDGSTSASERGDLISSFNRDDSEGDQIANNVKLFLISTTAGGIGTNLAAANRVIIFDTHFNPAVDLQALYRCYRYGQTKPVFAYRFLAEGSMVSSSLYCRNIEPTVFCL